MLKLIKYELLRSYRNYFMLFVIYLALCVIVPFTVNIDFLLNILIIVFTILVVGLGFSIFISIVTDFWKSMFSREGYLTLTLPLSTAEVLLAKLIAAFIWSFVACLILLLGVGILSILLTQVMGSGITIDEIFSAFGELFSSLSGQDALAIVLTIIGLVVSGFQSIIYLYACMSAVHTKLVRNARVLVAVVLYFAGTIFLNWVLNALGLSSEIAITSTSQFNQWWVLQIVVNALLAIAFFFTTAYIIDNHIELDA